MLFHVGMTLSHSLMVTDGPLKLDYASGVEVMNLNLMMMMMMMIVCKVGGREAS